MPWCSRSSVPVDVFWTVCAICAACGCTHAAAGESALCVAMCVLDVVSCAACDCTHAAAVWPVRHVDSHTLQRVSNQRCPWCSSVPVDVFWTVRETLMNIRGRGGDSQTALLIDASSALGSEWNPCRAALVFLPICDMTHHISYVELRNAS
eukprot:1161415-Pelagomonas_calceolata.AAC.4